MYRCQLGIGTRKVLLEEFGSTELEYGQVIQFYRRQKKGFIL